MTESQRQQQIIQWIEQDEMRLLALGAAKQLALNDGCLAAGFVRNLVWDRLHGFSQSTPLNDIDVIYFNPQDTSLDTEKDFEQQLGAIVNLPWSVKNQARMHLLHDHAPYSSSSEAMSYWVETETVIGAKLNDKNQVELVAPVGTAELFKFSITPNPRHGDTSVLLERVQSKGWLARWPKLRLQLPQP